MWADAHLPWVRGRALMHGVRLLEADACDALDIVHVLMEEDLVQPDRAFQDVRSRVRSVIYEEMYGYDRSEWGGKAGGGAARGGAAAGETKPYIPPTDPGDLGKVLGAPLG